LLTLVSIRFGSLYDAGDKAVREDIITFATTKLLNAEPDKVEELTNDQRLACLSQRIPLEFNSTTYIAQANERKQVEGHMRVCLKIDAAFESMITVSASEPLLSEAAYTVGQKTVPMFGQFSKIDAYLNNHMVKSPEYFRHYSI